MFLLQEDLFRTRALDRESSNTNRLTFPGLVHKILIEKKVLGMEDLVTLKLEDLRTLKKRNNNDFHPCRIKKITYLWMHS